MTQEILNANPPDLVPNVEEDRVLWLPSNTGVYISKSAWEAIRTARPNVTCAHIVWFPQHTSRWSILWIACHGRLLAKDRLASWGVISSLMTIVLSAIWGKNFLAIFSLNAITLVQFGAILCRNVGIVISLRNLLWTGWEIGLRAKLLLVLCLDWCFQLWYTIFGGKEMIGCFS